jgi:hypothetical protein
MVETLPALPVDLARVWRFVWSGRRQGIEVVSMRQDDHAPLLRLLMLVTAGSAEGR